MSGPMIPAVTPAAALDDCSWFAARPDRHFRLRQDAGGLWWVIRRKGSVFLRTFARDLACPQATTDSDIRAIWYALAWPQLTPAQRKKLIPATPKQKRR